MNISHLLLGLPSIYGNEVDAMRSLSAPFLRWSAEASRLRDFCIYTLTTWVEGASQGRVRPRFCLTQGAS